jgi:pimeloyl-ACP methyl ester carboxylesterase
MTTTATTSATARFAELAGSLQPGADDGRAPLVFLHGLTFDRAMWGPALAALAELDPGRTTLTLDLPGHGGSADAFRGRDAVGAQIGAAVTAAGLEAPVYVGHSIGAMPAMMLAAAGGGRGVVNVDAVLHVEPLLTFIASQTEQLHGAGYAAVWAALLDGMIPEGMPSAAEHLVRSTSNPRQRVMLGYWQPIFEAGGVRAECEQVLIGIGAMRALNIPYLIVAGHAPDAAYRAYLDRNFPEAEVTMLPNSGHFPHVVHPRTFAELLALT